MADMSALERRAKELREGITRSRYDLEAFQAGNNVYPGGNAPNPSGSNQYTPYFNAAYELEKGGILGQQAQAQSGARSAIDRLTGQVTREGSALSKLREQALRSNKYGMADQGILRSGINIDRQSEIGRDFLEASQELQQGAAQGKQDIETELSMQEAGFNQQLIGAELNRAEQEKEYRIQQALREAELKADQEALAATEREIEELKNEKLPKASKAGKYTPPGAITKSFEQKQRETQNKKLIAQAKAQNKIRQQKGLPARSTKIGDIRARVQREKLTAAARAANKARRKKGLPARSMKWADIQARHKKSKG